MSIRPTKVRPFLFHEGFSAWDGIMNQLNNSIWCNGADFRLPIIPSDFSITLSDSFEQKCSNY